MTDSKTTVSEYEYAIINPETKEVKSRFFSLSEIIQGAHWYWRDFMNKGFVSIKDFQNKQLT